MPPGPRLLFPAGSDAGRARAYAERYLREARRGRAPLFRADAETAAEWAGRSTGPLPATLDPKEGLGRLAPAAQAVLTRKRGIMLDSWRARFPLLPGERLLEEEVSATSEPWAGNPPHTLLYRRTTDQGELAVVIQNSRIDPATGKLTYEEPPARVARHAPLPALFTAQDDRSGIDLVESALSALTWVGFAVGGPGVVVSAAAGVLEVVLHAAFPPKKIDIPREVHEILARDFANDHVEQNLTRIMAYTQWFADQNAKALAGEYSDAQKAGYADALASIRTAVNNACDPSNALLQAVSDLKNGSYESVPPYPIRALPVFMLAASTHLLFAKCRILLSTDGTTYKSPYTTDLVNAAKSYLAHVQSVQGDIDSAFDERLRSISPPDRESFDAASAVGEFVQTWTEEHVLVRDPKADQFPTQPWIDRPWHLGGEWDHVVYSSQCAAKGCSGDVECDMEGARSWTADYRNRLTAQLAERYNYGDKRKADVSKFIDQLNGVIKAYADAA